MLLNRGSGLDRCRGRCNCSRVDVVMIEVLEECTPASSRLDSGNVCVQVSGVCAAAGG